MELAIIIPTMNRSELLLGQLFFYDSFGCSFKVYVGDSSTQAEKYIIRKGIEKLRHISVDFVDCPSSMMQVEVIIDLINRTKEEFISVSGDDDYHVIPHALRSVDFLKKNPSYAACTGMVAMVSTTFSNGMRRINDISDYSPKTEIINEQPLERIKLLSEKYYLPLFCICRTKDFVEAFSTKEKIKHNIFWAETLPAFKLVAIGKLHLLDGLAMIRGTHDLRPNYKNAMCDTFMNKDWTDSLQITLNTLTDYLVKKGLNEQMSRLELTKVFSEYYSEQLLKMSQEKINHSCLKKIFPTPFKIILKKNYYRFNSNKINNGSQYSYSKFYDIFTKLRLGFSNASEIIKNNS